MYNRYLELKENNIDKIVIIKNGEFYYTYDKDAYIINYFFKYKIINSNSEYMCFPNKSLNNIIKFLNNKCIGYLIFDRIILDISFGDSEIYNNTLLDYYDKKNKKDLIDKICCLLNTKTIEELKLIYSGIK